MTTTALDLNVDDLSRSTLEDEEAEAGKLPAEDVIARVNSILGYDVLEEALLAEGYREMSNELHEWSESTLAAQAETLPEE